MATGTYLDVVKRSKELITTYMDYISEQSEMPLVDIDIKKIDKAASVMQKLFKLLGDVQMLENRFASEFDEGERQIKIEDVHTVLSLCREWGVLNDNYETDAHAIYKKIQETNKEIKLR